MISNSWLLLFVAGCTHAPTPQPTAMAWVCAEALKTSPCHTSWLTGTETIDCRKDACHPVLGVVRGQATLEVP